MIQDGGHSANALRLEDMVDRAVLPSSYDALVGRYAFGPHYVISITRSGERLLLQMPKSVQVETFPKSPTSFFLMRSNASIDFIIKDGEERASSVVARNGNGQGTEGRRISD
jgi:uncharacterized protein DUF3471